MSQQFDLFPNLECSKVPELEARSTPFDADVAWLFESATGLEPNEYMDAAFFRLGWSGSASDREAEIRRCVHCMLEMFVADPAFAADISHCNEMPHSRIDREVARFLKARK